MDSDLHASCASLRSSNLVHEFHTSLDSIQWDLSAEGSLSLGYLNGSRLSVWVDYGVLAASSYANH